MKRTALRPVSRKRAKLNRVRTELLRSVKGGPCQVRWDDACTGIAVDGDEILSRARGGSITERENVRGVCRHCHDQLTTHPAEAERRGLTLHSWEAKGD